MAFCFGLSWLVSQDVLGPDGNGGYQHVVSLAKELVKLQYARYVLPTQADELVALWQKLPAVDRAPVKFRPRHKRTLNKGMFRAGKTGRKAIVPGTESLTR